MAIQIPESLYKGIMKFVRYQILWYLRDHFTKEVREQLPEHWKAFKSYVKDLDVKLPKEKHPNKNVGARFPFDVSSMGPQYQKLTPIENTVFVALDWEGTLIGNRSDTRAAWFPRKSALMIYLNHFDMLHDYTKRGSHPANIVHIFSDLSDTIRHELQHTVQDYLLAPVAPKQIEKKPKYSDHDKDYYTSQVEFEPTIASAVNEFINNYIIVSEAKPVDLGKAFRQYVGAAPSWKYDPFAEAKIFKHLKATSPKRYKIAVRKFYEGVMERLKKIQKT